MTDMTDTKITRPAPATPPVTVNGFPVLASALRPGDHPGELTPQYGVACKDTRYGRTVFIAWTIAWDPNYQDGSWVAFWGHYDLTWERAQEIMADKARP